MGEYSSALFLVGLPSAFFLPTVKCPVRSLCAYTIIPKPDDTLVLWSSPVFLDTSNFCSKLSNCYIPELEAWLADSF